MASAPTTLRLTARSHLRLASLLTHAQGPSWKLPSSIRGHLLALGTAVLALGLALALAPLFNDAPVPLFLLAVLASAFVGGQWPGFLSVAICAVFLVSFFDLSRASPLPSSADTAFDLGLFVAVASVMSWMTAHLRITNGRLKQARAEAEAAIRIRDDFLASAAHDLKGPLCRISMTAQVVRHGLEALEREASAPGDLAGQLRYVDSEARRMATVLDELVDVAHLEIGHGLELKRTCTSLLDVVRDAVAGHQAHATDHVLRVIDRADPVGAWDATRLRRVLDNLIANAIKYSPEGGEVTVELDIETGQSGEQWAMVRVRDQGLGIPEADIQRVFDRFFRARNVGRISGMGIGLAGAREVIEQHGGTLAVESREGAGTTFALRLPV